MPLRKPRYPQPPGARAGAESTIATGPGIPPRGTGPAGGKPVTQGDYDPGKRPGHQALVPGGTPGGITRTPLDLHMSPAVGSPAGGPSGGPVTPPPDTGPVDEAGYPLTPASAAARTGAEETYGITTGEANQSLYRAALGYGDPDILGLYGEYGPVVENPNSDLATIARNEALQHTNLGNQMNAQNLFFSGTNQRGQTAVSTEAGKGRADAYQRFKDAEQRLINAKAIAGAKRRDVYRTTGADDIAASLAQPPQPTGTAPGDTPLPVPPKAPTSGSTKTPKAERTRKSVRRSPYKKKGRK